MLYERQKTNKFKKYNNNKFEISNVNAERCWKLDFVKCWFRWWFLSTFFKCWLKYLIFKLKFGIILECTFQNVLILECTFQKRAEHKKHYTISMPGLSSYKNFNHNSPIKFISTQLVPMRLVSMTLNQSIMFFLNDQLYIGEFVIWNTYIKADGAVAAR